MNYQSLVNTIRNVANTVNPPPQGRFIHARRTDGSLEYDGPFPQIHLLPVQSEYDLNNDNVKHTVVLMFWQQDTPETTNERREEIIAEMDDLSDIFLFTLNASSSLNLSNVLKTPEYRQLAGTLSGYGLSFVISSKIDCPIIPPPSDCPIITVDNFPDKFFLNQKVVSYAPILSDGVYSPPFEIVDFSGTVPDGLALFIYDDGLGGYSLGISGTPTNLEDYIFYLKIKDSNGCESDLHTFSISIQP